MASVRSKRGSEEAVRGAGSGRREGKAAAKRSGDVEGLRGLAIDDTRKFRLRSRLNRALPKDTPVDEARDRVVLEAIIGDDNSLPFYVLELGATVGRAVCKVWVPDGQHGTGFLVGPGLLLTNHHVLWSVDRAKDAACVFDYQLGPDRKEKATASFQLDPDSLFLTSPTVDKGGLDYTFVRIDPQASERFGAIRLSRGSFGALINEYANIVHHPRGTLKRVSLQENKVTRDSGVFLRYVSDTEGGSSGSPVLNNDWQLIALHHASTVDDGKNVNQGVKLSAIAADVERRSQQGGGDRTAALEALRAFRDTDSLLGGYFGGLGRPSRADVAVSERVTDLYRGEAHDIDVGFWNIEWFTRRWKEKLNDVAKLVAELNLDIYALAESSPEATGHLRDFLERHYGLVFACASSEPDAPKGRQSTTVLWNTKTLEGARLEWPDKLKPWFDVDSRHFADLGLGLEAVHGKVFDRYPGLFYFRAGNREGSGEPFDFYLVPLHLKAMAEGSLRRRMAARILGAAIKRMIDDPEISAEDYRKDPDWIIGGDVNAELATDDFKALFRDGMVPISAEDEGEGAMTYLKSPKSLIDHIFLSPNLARTYGARDFFIYAADERTPDYVKTVSDHRPVLVRLSLGAATAADGDLAGLPPGLADELRRLGMA